MGESANPVIAFHLEGLCGETHGLGRGWMIYQLIKRWAGISLTRSTTEKISARVPNPKTGCRPFWVLG